MPPLQIMFQATTNHSLPPMNERRKCSLYFNWQSLNLYNFNYYFNLETIQQIVKNIFIPYQKAQVGILWKCFPCLKTMRWFALLHIVPFCKGPNQKSEGFAKGKKKREGFAKEKKPATFAMPSASQLVAQQSSQIYNEPLIIAALLRDS
jgi:hypothetical protein